MAIYFNLLYFLSTSTSNFMWQCIGIYSHWILHGFGGGIMGIEMNGFFYSLHRSPSHKGSIRSIGQHVHFRDNHPAEKHRIGSGPNAIKIFPKPLVPIPPVSPIPMNADSQSAHEWGKAKVASVATTTWSNRFPFLCDKLGRQFQFII